MKKFISLINKHLLLWNLSNYQLNFIYNVKLSDKNLKIFYTNFKSIIKLGKYRKSKKLYLSKKKTN